MRFVARECATGNRYQIAVENGVFTEVTRRDDETEGGEPAIERWFAPSLFDLQINGAFGHSFNAPDLTVEQIREVVLRVRQSGVGGFLPTLVTQSREGIAHGLRTLERSRCDDPLIAATVPAYHVEGPYISAEDGPRGAHPKEHVREADWDEFRAWQDAAEGRIRLLTLSPEGDTALRFIEQATASGVVIAIGHTAATPERIRDAVSAGAKLATHLGNGSHATWPRHENYFFAQLAADDLWASFIPDGHHLPDTLLKILWRTKGAERLVITCDAGSLAGLPPGRYSQWGTELEVHPAGKIVLPGTPYLAGAAVFTDHCVNHFATTLDLELRDVLPLATTNPRTLLGIEMPKFAIGEVASLVLFESDATDRFRVTGLVDRFG